MSDFQQSPDEQAVDLGVIEQLKASLGDDEEFVAELISQFLENTPRLINDIDKAVMQNDAEALQLAAHSLKSTCATLGATEMTKIAFALEMSGREKTMENIVENATKLSDAYAHAKGMFEARLRNAA